MESSWSRSVLVARHGQTCSNVAGRYAGWSTEGLTDNGRAQARVMSDAVRHMGITRLRSSAIVRAAETASIVGDRLGIPTLTDPRLNELKMGPWEGLAETEVARRFPTEYGVWCNRPDQLHLPGRETLSELAERVSQALSDSIESRERELIITHVAIVRVGILLGTRRPLRDYRQLPVPNCQPVRVSVWSNGDGTSARVLRAVHGGANRPSEDGDSDAGAAVASG